MSEDVRPIVVKRIKKVAGGHHGGAWKLAYADFMTAMMAFFLLMWLLGSTSSGDLKGIAEFFLNPMKVSMSGGSGSGDATSILKGGGQDLTKDAGQGRGSDADIKSREPSVKNAAVEELRKEYEKREKERLKDLKRRLEGIIEGNLMLRQFKNQLVLEVTPEGLRIQIIDELNRPMFDTSSSQLKPYTREILNEIGKVLNSVPNRISLTGHTDAAQFSGGEKGFSNWELSADRANSSRRELIIGGMEESKILRIVGRASTSLFDKNDPLIAANRRNSIIVLNKRTEEAILQEDGNAGIQVSDEEDTSEIESSAQSQ